MKNKIFILIILCLVVFTGCSKKEKTKVLECELNATTITLTFDKGKIVKYVDKVTGDISSSEIDLLNKNYLENITNNDDAISKMIEVIASTGGDCKQNKE